jgi:hypothetical protein
MSSSLSSTFVRMLLTTLTLCLAPPLFEEVRPARRTPQPRIQAGGSQNTQDLKLTFSTGEADPGDCISDLRGVFHKRALQAENLYTRQLSQPR